MTTIKPTTKPISKTKNIKTLDNVNPRLWQVRLNLRYSKPPIWRLLVINPEVTFRELAHTIMMACEYVGNHLYEFQIKLAKPNALTNKFLKTLPGSEKIGIENLFKYRAGIFDLHSISADGNFPLDTKVTSLINPETDKIKFSYDLASNIDYELKFEKYIDSTDSTIPQIPYCLKAKGQAPSEYNDLGFENVSFTNALFKSPEGYVSQYHRYEKEMNEDTQSPENGDPRMTTMLLLASQFDEHGRQFLDWSKIPVHFGGTLDVDVDEFFEGLEKEFLSGDLMNKLLSSQEKQTKKTKQSK